MSLKQISFSPELLYSPEIRDIPMPEEPCQFTAKMDLSQIEYISPRINNQYGGRTKEENMGLSSHEDEDEDKDEGLNPVNFDSHPQAGGFEFQIESDTTMNEVTNNPDNPGEDPPQADDIIDENRRSHNWSINDRIRELKKINSEVTSVEQEARNKELEEINIDDSMDYDLTELNNQLVKELDLYWDKELDEAYVENKVNEYIDNYNSPEYKTYRSMFMYILSKTKIGYHVDVNSKGEYLLYKNHMDNYEIRLVPPKYVNVADKLLDLDEELKKLEFDLSNLKMDLVDNADRIVDADTLQFKKMQKEYYNTKHIKAIYIAYYTKINKLEGNESEMFINFMRKKTNSKNETIHVIETNYVKTSEIFQENIKQLKISSLKLFNQVMDTYHKQSQSGKKLNKSEQKELHVLIKKYLITGSANTIIHIVEQYHKEFKKRVPFVIEKRPIIDVAKNKSIKVHKDNDVKK